MPTVAVRDIRVYYEVHGNPDGEPLVLLHGFFQTGQSNWGRHLAQLGERYRLYPPDWRGHGRTTNPSGTIVHSEVAEDIAAFVRAIGVERAHYGGHSSGAMVLQFLALRHHDLTHTSAMMGGSYTFDERVQTIAREQTADDARVPEQQIQRLQTLHGQTHGPDYRRTLRRLWAESVQRPGELPFTPADLIGIRCPTLVLHGDRDHFFPVHIPVTMYPSIPQAELCLLPNCGHGPPFQRPQLCAAALLDFLDRHPLDPREATTT